MSSAPRRTSLRFSNATSSPLGQVTITGFAVPQEVAMEGPRVFGQYALVYILDGEGTYADANGWKQTVGPGDLMLVFPELEHTYNPRLGTQWLTTFLCFAGPVFDLWRQSGLIDARRPVHHLQPLDVWSRRIEAVLGGTRQAGFAPPLVEVCRLQELLAAIATGEGRAETYREDQLWAQRACGLIEVELDQSAPDWAHIAARFGLTAEGFRKRFTRITGQTPARYQTGRRIDRACDLMQQSTRMTDRQIAELLGFCDEFYFSRRFKEITGQSPRAFRQGNRFHQPPA
ncbi:MAG: AraC family transcriptional regulator [Candidatus Methylacidiphilales bacterium]